MSSSTERHHHRRRSRDEVSTAPGWRGVVEQWGERGVFYLLCLMLISAPLALGAVRPWSRDPLEWLTMAALLCWAARVAAATKTAWIRTPLDWPLLGGAVYVVARYAASPVEWISRQEMLLVLMYVSVYFLVTQHFFRRRRQNALLWVLVAVAVGITAYGLISRLRGVQMVWWFPYEDSLQRVRGTYFCPDHFAGYLELTLAVAMAHLLWSGRGAAQRIVLAYAASVMIVGIVFSGSRGGYISAGAMILFLLAAVARGVTRRWWPALVVVLVGVLGGVWGIYGIEPLHARFFSPYYPGVISGDRSRLWMCQAAWQMTLDHPWFGVGPFLFNSFYGRYRDPVDQAIPEYVHSDHLQALCDYGVAGFALMGLLVGAFLVATWRIHRRWRRCGVAEPSGWHWPFWLDLDRAGRPAWLLAGASAVVAYLLHSVVDFNLHISANALTLTVILAMGMLAGHSRRLTENLPDRLKPLSVVIQPVDLGFYSRWILAALLVMFVAAEGALAVPNAVSSFWQLLGEKRYAKAQFAAAHAAAERAWAWDPRNYQAALLLGDVISCEARFSSNNNTALAEQALQWYRRAEKLNPLEAEPVSRQALMLEYLSRWKAAEERHQHALTMDPNYHVYYERLGLFHSSRGEAEKAVTELQAALIFNCTTPSERAFLLSTIQRLTSPGAPRR